MSWIHGLPAAGLTATWLRSIERGYQEGRPGECRQGNVNAGAPGVMALGARLERHGNGNHQPARRALAGAMFRERAVERLRVKARQGTPRSIRLR
jgi:hypothetical protein